MEKRGVNEWRHRPILRLFLVSRTPREVEKVLGIKKLKMKPFLDKGLLKSLNPRARKCRFYILTNKARRLLGLPRSCKTTKKDWDLIGFIKGSPKQRSVILKTVDSVKRTSEEIREKASRFNPHLSRISTKGILKELISKKLIESEMNGMKRYYWITVKGKSVLADISLDKG